MKRPVEDHGQRSLARPSSSPVRIVLLGRFALVDGRGASIPVANATRRLLSFLALRDRVVHRASVAGTLWPDVSESHAHASLRSSLLRIPNRARSVITVTGSELCLSDGVDIDVRDAQALAHRLLDETLPWKEGDVSRATISQLAFDLLPGWLDEWVVPEAEGWRQLRLHALEALTDHLAVQHRFGDATAAALTAIKAEPLRESAHAALIRVHFAESNQSEAFRQFERYQDLLRAALGIEPTTRLRELVGL
jgi:DNA-binding SARP family transcriptional activator